MPLKERTLNLFSSLELLLPYLYKIKSGVLPCLLPPASCLPTHLIMIS